MTSRLVIGILRISPGWRLLMDQIGAPFEVIRSVDNLDPARTSVLILPFTPGPDEVVGIESYLRAGGAVLDIGAFLPLVDRSSITHRRRRVIVPDANDPVFRDVGPIALDTSLPIHRASKHADGSVHLGEWKGGSIAYVPFPVDRLLLRTDARRRSFHATSPRHPNEIVSSVDKGGLRRLVHAALRWLHHRRRLPFIHAPSLPREHDGVIGFRVDSDYGTRKEIVEMRNRLHDAGAATTWFLHVEAHADWLDLFTTFDGDEIGLHCMRHRTYGTYEENKANLSAGLSLMRAACLEPRGCAAPNGFWNIELARAVHDLGFEYASEFSLDFDDLPFNPWMHDLFSPLLEIPIHPICVGSFLRAKGSDDDMRRYFSEVVDRGVARREPVILYGHPGHGKYDLIADDIEHAIATGCAPMTMGDVARWWKRRSAIRFEGTIEGESVSVRWKGGDEEIGLEIEHNGRRASIDGGDGRHLLGQLDWKTPPRTTQAQRPGRRPGLLGWRQSLEDFNARIGQ